MSKNRIVCGVCKQAGLVSFVVALMVVCGSVSGVFYFVVENQGCFDVTSVCVDPVGQTVGFGESFTVDVFCVPGQPVKGWELCVLFNASLIQADAVVEGDIFSNFSTFFNDGTIDNNAGSIIDIYNLIIGAGNVTGAGSLCSISFTAGSVCGVSVIELFNVGVTNETAYVPVAVTNGSVTVFNSPPVISNPDPADGAVGVSVSLDEVCVDIVDGEGDSFNWSVETCPDVGSCSVVGDVSGRKCCAVSGLEFGMLYRWFVNVTDCVSGVSVGAVFNFTTETNNPPYEPSDPIPENGSVNVSITTTISWTGGDPDAGDTVTYDVYFDTTSPPDLVVSNQSTTTYSPGVLEQGTLYYWQIVAWDEHGAKTSGPIWHFTTGANQPPAVPTISGPSSGFVCGEYEFIVSTEDPDGNDVYYWIEWGDGTNTSWLGPYTSGESVSVYKEWLAADSFIITVKAKDDAGTETTWSDPHVITVAEGESKISRTSRSINSWIAEIMNSLLIRSNH